MHIPIPAGTVEDTFEHAIEIIAETFRDDPFQRYALIEELQAEGVRDISYELNKAVFSDVIPGMVQDGARSLTTVELSGVASVWVVQAVTPTFTPIPHFPYAVNEINGLAHQARRKHVPKGCKEMLHLILLGNDRSHPSHDPSRNSKVSDVIRPVLQMAKEMKWPVVLEATTEKSRDVYLHLGLEILEEITVGKGKIDREGRAKEGGEGCLLWSMMKRCD